MNCFTLNNELSVQELNQIAMDTFMANSNTILKIGKDSQGREFLQIQNKNLWSWIAVKLFGFENYKLEKVVKFINENQEDGFDQLQDKDQAFYEKLNEKITKYNCSRPDSSALSCFVLAKTIERVSSPVFTPKSPGQEEFMRAQQPQVSFIDDVLENDVVENPMDEKAEIAESAKSDEKVESDSISCFSALPEEMKLKIISFLSVAGLGQMTSVNKELQELINKQEDEIWSNFCKNKGLGVKDPSQTWKEHYQTSPYFIGNDKVRIKDLKIQLPIQFAQRIEESQLDNYQLLNFEDIKALFTTKDMISCFNQVPYPVKGSALPADVAVGQKDMYTLRYVAQQKVGKTEFNIISYVDIVVGFNSNYELIINNKPTDIIFTEDDCQLVIYVADDTMYIYNKDIGKDNFSPCEIRRFYRDFM